MDRDNVEMDDWEFDYAVHFAGPCTCDHEEEDHSWGECGEPGCTCQAGWEE